MLACGRTGYKGCAGRVNSVSKVSTQSNTLLACSHTSCVQPHTNIVFDNFVLQPYSSPTGPVGPIGSDLESGRQVHGKGGEGLGKVIDQCPEEDTKCL